MVAPKEEKSETFKNKSTQEETKGVLVIILTLIFYVAIVLLIAFLGSHLWNEYLVPATTCVKKVDTIQILAIYLLVRFFIM